MTARREHGSVFEQIKAGLADSIAHSRGDLDPAAAERADLSSPPPDFSPEEIATVRRRHRMSRATFAAVLNVPPRTVENWERARARPAGAALRLLQLLAYQPPLVRKFLSIAGVTSAKQDTPAQRPKGPTPKEGAR